jgi:hypothetical protein
MGVPKSGEIVKSRFLLTFGAILGCLLATAQALDHTGKSVPKHPVSGSSSASPSQTLDQMPAVPPQVVFQNGQLTITAKNCTLGDVLKAVHAQTGAHIELPGNAGDRVVGSFGPGPARDVLSTLLNGSHFNYVLLGSEADPQALDRVILTAKTAASSQPGTPTQEANANSYPGSGYAAAPPPMRPLPPRPGMAPNVAAPNQQEAQAEESTDDADADSADDSTDADSADDTDQTDDQQAEETTVQGQDPAAPDQAVKTPEQMLQELQQQQQQQQQGVQAPGVRPGFPPNGMPPGLVQAPH